MWDRSALKLNILYEVHTIISSSRQIHGGMSVTPPLEDQLPKINKFVGESFSTNNTRIIYAGSEEDTKPRDNKVILLIGPTRAGKSSLIDFLCNYFYGAKWDNDERYNIANENPECSCQKFDGSTPYKDIITYVFNDSVMDIRPVVIDTPETGGRSSEDLPRLFAEWLKENYQIKIDLIGVILSASVQMTLEEENDLKKIIDLLPLHTKPNIAVFITNSDGSSLKIGTLERFNLDQAGVYKVNTSCLYQKCQGKPLLEHLRENCWKMTVANLNAVFSRLKLIEPVTVCGSIQDSEPIMSDLIEGSMKKTPYSSQNSVNTVIHCNLTLEEDQEKIPDINETSTCSTSVTTRNYSIYDETVKPQPFIIPTSKDNKQLPNLISQISQRTSRSEISCNDEVIVVEYEKARPEVVVLHHTQPYIESLTKESPINISLTNELITEKSYREDRCSFSKDNKTKQICINPYVLLTEISDSEPIDFKRTSCAIHHHHHRREAQNLNANEQLSKCSLVTKSVNETFPTSGDVNHDEKQTNDRIQSFTECYRPTPANSGADMRDPTYLNAGRTIPLTCEDGNIKPTINSGEMRNFNKYQSDDSSEPTSILGNETVIRYVFDVDTKTHKSHIVHQKDCTRRAEDQLQQSKVTHSHFPSEKKTDNDDERISYINISKKNSRQNSTCGTNGLPSHDNQVPTLIRSETNYTIIDSKRSPVETIIDFPSQSRESHGVFQRNDVARHSRHASGNRWRSFDPLEQLNSVTLEKNSEQCTSIVTNYVPYEDMPVRLRYETIPKNRQSSTLSSMHLSGSNNARRYSQELNVLSRSGSIAKAKLPLYANMHKNECMSGRNSPGTESMTNTSAVSSKQFEEINVSPEKDGVLRSTHHGMQQNVNDCRPVYENISNIALPPYDFVSDSDPPLNQIDHFSSDKAHIIIKKNLGHADDDQAHASITEIQKKPEDVIPPHHKQNPSLTQKPKYTPHQYKDSDYDDNWDDATIRKKVTEVPTSSQYTGIRHGQPSNKNHILSDREFQSPPPPPYHQRLCRTAPISTISPGHDEDRELGGEKHLLQVKQERRTTARKVISKSNWNPANCANPRDRCLNCLFFILGPILIIIIIIVVIITLISS